jgi:hypothetical protein
LETIIAAPNFQKYMAELRERGLGPGDAQGERIARTVKELELIGFNDPTEFLAGDYQFISLQDIRDKLQEKARAIESINIRKFWNRETSRTESILEIKFWDKMQALKMLALHQGMFQEVLQRTDAPKPVILPDNGTRDISDQVVVQTITHKRGRPKKIPAMSPVVPEGAVHAESEKGQGQEKALPAEGVSTVSEGDDAKSGESLMGFPDDSQRGDEE